ncbi:MAG: hypothetical protein SH856_10165 [Flavobacteriales bacterium]|nr:hypothetical protein [Flavobacteriales bacterium]
MKSNLFLVLLLTALTSLNTTAQDDVLDNIAQDACTCMETADNPSALPEELEMQLGLCLIAAAQPYEKELKKKHGIDLNNMDDETAEKLGISVGVNMALKCPKLFMAMAGANQEEIFSEPDDEIYDMEGFSVFEGRINTVSVTDIVILSATNESGAEEFYWLTPIDGIEIPQNLNDLSGKQVLIEYRQEEIFDPKMLDYKLVNMITSIYMD